MKNNKFLPLSKLSKLLLILALLGLSSACSTTSPYNKPSTGNSGTSNTPSSSQLNTQKQQVVMSALNQVGTPYRYGGSSPSHGFDCSGLVQFSYASAGVNVPRTTREQMQRFRHVSRNNLQTGDLVFFQTGRNQYHVAIMINQNEFVHAPSSGKTVSTSSFSNPYWKANFIKAGRL